MSWGIIALGLALANLSAQTVVYEDARGARTGTAFEDKHTCSIVGRGPRWNFVIIPVAGTSEIEFGVAAVKGANNEIPRGQRVRLSDHSSLLVSDREVIYGEQEYSLTAAAHIDELTTDYGLEVGYYLSTDWNFRPEDFASSRMAITHGDMFSLDRATIAQFKDCLARFDGFDRNRARQAKAEGFEELTNNPDFVQLMREHQYDPETRYISFEVSVVIGPHDNMAGWKTVTKDKDLMARTCAYIADNLRFKSSVNQFGIGEDATVRLRYEAM